MRQLQLGDGSIVVDLFAGGGGASIGIEAALGRPVDVAINHDPVALAVHRANDPSPGHPAQVVRGRPHRVGRPRGGRHHPSTRHLEADVWEVRPKEATGGRPVRLLWASPDCTHFSIAKGDVPRKQSIRTLAWVVTRWAAEVRPDVICLENVREFQGWGPLGSDGLPDKARMGQTFRAWQRRLERLGYVVDHRVIDSSTLGAATKRRRLYLVARCDGLPIVWPEATHGPGMLPLRTAAECIDWSIPCLSIFERAKPLADKTLWRIAQGIKRFVLDNPAPFLLEVNHGKWEPRARSLQAPLPTITAARRSTALVVPSLVQTGYGERMGQRARTLDICAPLGTAVSGQKHAIVAAFLAKSFGDPRRTSGGGVVLGSEVGAPIGTVTARDHHGLAAVALTKFRGTSAAHPGSADIEDPLGTITAGGGRGGVHDGIAAAFLTKHIGWSGFSAADQPMQTIRAGGPDGHTHFSEVRAFLVRHRVDRAHVTIDGESYAIVDIGLRMLQPHELLRAQFGRFAVDYDLSAAKTKAAKVRLIGNSVCPEVAEAIVRANLRVVVERRRKAARV